MFQKELAKLRFVRLTDSLVIVKGLPFSIIQISCGLDFREERSLFRFWVIHETQLRAVFVFFKVLPPTLKLTKQTKLHRQVLEGHHQESLHFVDSLSVVFEGCFFAQKYKWNAPKPGSDGVFLLDILKPFSICPLKIG